LFWEQSWALDKKIGSRCFLGKSDTSIPPEMGFLVKSRPLGEALAYAGGWGALEGADGVGATGGAAPSPNWLRVGAEVCCEAPIGWFE